MTSNYRGKGNAQPWMVKMIIMGISYRNLKKKQKKFNKVRNFITFSIVFTQKNGMDRINPPSPLKKHNFNPTFKTKVKSFIQYKQ